MIFRIDEDCYVFNKNRDVMNCYLRQEEDVLNTIISNLGYIYKNDIYESLGQKWDPESMYNEAYVFSEEDRAHSFRLITFQEMRTEDGQLAIVVHIKGYEEN